MHRSITISLISGGILSLIMASAWGNCLTESVCGFTYQQLDGNRLITGTGSFIDQDPIEIPLDHPADWVVAVPTDQGAIWVDWDGRPGREVIVTLSDAESGGQIGVFDERGQELGRGPGLGQEWVPQIDCSCGWENRREANVKIVDKAFDVMVRLNRFYSG